MTWTRAIDRADGRPAVRCALNVRSRSRSRARDGRRQSTAWPIGATASVLLCVAAASSVLRASTIQEPDSLAAMISALGSPGSESRPLRPADNGISFPRLSEHDGMRASGTMEQIPEDDVIYAFRTVIGRDGSLSDTELLPATTRRGRSPCGRTGRGAGDGAAQRRKQDPLRPGADPARSRRGRGHGVAGCQDDGRRA